MKLKPISKKCMHCEQFPAHNRNDCPAKETHCTICVKKGIILAFAGKISQYYEK